METNVAAAATLQKKKSSINKKKVKKTIKNILCRPDLLFWPKIKDEQANILEAALSKYKVNIPEFHNFHWKILKVIPKDQRPKKPKIKKVEGLIFGITECGAALKSKECSAVILEATINPRIIVQPLIEVCISNQVPVLCMNDLRKITSQNFGIPTCCLAIKSGFLEELSCKIKEIAKLDTRPQPTANNEAQQNMDNPLNKMEVDKITKQEISTTPISFTYLYRTSKKTRVFNPSSEEPKEKKAFTGQDFIEINKPEQQPENKPYMSMIVKRITNNQNRTKTK